MNIFERLYKKAHTKQQLLRYLNETRQQLIDNPSQCSIYKAGAFFDRAYGLDLSDKNIINLGWYIHSGQYKVHFDINYNVVKLHG